jgi:hypothetical protein
MGKHEPKEEPEEPNRRLEALELAVVQLGGGALYAKHLRDRGCPLPKHVVWLMEDIGGAPPIEDAAGAGEMEPRDVDDD